MKKTNKNKVKDFWNKKKKEQKLKACNSIQNGVLNTPSVNQLTTHLVINDNNNSTLEQQLKTFHSSIKKLQNSTANQLKSSRNFQNILSIKIFVIILNDGWMLLLSFYGHAHWSVFLTNKLHASKTTFLLSFQR